MKEPDQESTREILRKVRQIEIKSNRLVSEVLSGSYQSAFKGQGIDFEEVREYQPGDEVRSIDWNVTAKMGLPFVKQYREERELTILLAIDISESHRCFSPQTASLRRLRTSKFMTAFPIPQFRHSALPLHLMAAWGERKLCSPRLYYWNTLSIQYTRSHLIFLRTRVH